MTVACGDGVGSTAPSECYECSNNTQSLLCRVVLLIMVASIDAPYNTYIDNIQV